MLECTPSVANCAHAQILPVDFSAAEPTAIPPGGAESTAETNTGGAYGAKLSQDGTHFGFSDIRTDSVEMMVVGTLTRSAAKYAVVDPKVINPATPTSAADQNVDAWSNGGALYEFKTFTHGGADATYVESGGPALLNADVWSVNLKTGQRTRLTANPDYDEDNAGSPNGKLLALWSNRTMHLTDWYSGLLPVRDFIDTPASLMILGISSSNKRCHGPIWILPSGGDRGAALSGQPIVDYQVPHVFVTNNLTGWPKWSPDGTMLALNTTNNRPGPGYPARAPFLLVAHFQALKASQPLRAVSSQPGSWAVAPAQYHPVFGYSGVKTFAGTSRGTVTVNYGPLSGVFAGQWSESYVNYSDNGKDFVNGTVSIDETGPGVGTYTANLTMTGANTGSDHVQYNSATGAGHGVSTYDGHTVSGPSAAQAAKGACPAIQPTEPPLRVSVTKLGNSTIRVKVTSRVASVGANESILETPPVSHATVRLGRTTAVTNAAGIAIIAVRHRGPDGDRRHYVEAGLRGRRGVARPVSGRLDAALTSHTIITSAGSELAIIAAPQIGPTERERRGRALMIYERRTDASHRCCWNLSGVRRRASAASQGKAASGRSGDHRWVLVPAAAASAASFTPGDVVVYRVGDGTTGLSSASAPVFLDEFGPSGGSPALSVGLPATTSGSNKALTASGSASSEGLLTLSGDQRYLILTGYDAPTGTASIAGTAAASIPRTVGRVGATGSADVDTSTALTDFADGNNPRSATSDNGTNIWVGGAAGGVRYTTLGSSSSTMLNTADKNVRAVSVVDGQLYTSADPTKTGSLHVATVGTGLPKSAPQSITDLPFSSLPNSPYGYSLLTLGTGTTPDTLYVADNGAGAVVKYGLVSGSWTPEGSVNVTGVAGLAANDVNGTVSIYATTSGSGTSGSLYEITDTSGQGGTLSGSANLIATAPSNEAYRGVAFAPGTTIGSGPGTPPVTPSISSTDTNLAAAVGDPTNPTLGLTVSDPNYDASQLTVTASSSDTDVASSATVSGSGAQRTLTVDPGTTVGYSTITLEVTAPDGTNATTTVTYGLSANQGDSSDRYYTGAGNASTEIDVGGGYMLAGDDLSNVIRLYDQTTSGPPVATFDFTGQLPLTTTSIDIESAARVGNVIYWLGSLSNSDSGNPRPAANTLFATQVNGSGASTTLTYLGSYTGLRDDLINWDESNGNPLGLSDSASGDSKTASGLNVEGFEFAKGSSTTAYLAFRAPLESPSARTDALLVPVTNIPSLIGAGAGSATFGTPIQMDLGGLGIREIRRDADGQFVIIAGSADSSDSTFGLYTWDGNPADPPALTNTTLDPVADGAWEGIVSVPDPLVDGSTVRLVEDNGDTDWYGDGRTSKSQLPTGLQKDLGRTFTISLSSQQVSFDSTPPDPGIIGGTYDVDASATSGLPVAYSIDNSSTAGACTISDHTVTFTGAGECVIDADQGGNTAYAPAPQAHQTVTVGGHPAVVDISTPTSGATYGKGQVIDAAYSCAPGVDGSPISSCSDNQGDGDGNPIETAATGTFMFTVTAVSENGDSNSETVTYTVKALVNTGTPTITGTAQDGQKLTASPGTWSKPSSSLTYKYKWQRCSDAAGQNCVPIQGATLAGYHVTKADVGSYLTVIVTATDKAGNTATATATPVGPVANPPAPVNTKIPHINGKFAKGQTLTATTGQWTSSDTLTYTYQWQDCDTTGLGCSNIGGATHSSYKLTSTDVTGTVTVIVTATDKEHQSASATATPVGPSGSVS